MRTSPDYQKQEPLPDVAFERDSVGAMSVCSAVTDLHSQFRPYIYRGTGIDTMPQFPETQELPKRKPKPKPKPKKRNPRKTYWRKAPDPRPRMSHQRLHFAPELPRPPYAPDTTLPPLDIMDESTWGNWTPPPRRNPLSPAAGWKPLTGADVEDMIAELMADGEA